MTEQAHVCDDTCRALGAANQALTNLATKDLSASMFYGRDRYPADVIRVLEAAALDVATKYRTALEHRMRQDEEVARGAKSNTR
jgi:hypothetical protein